MEKHEKPGNTAFLDILLNKIFKIFLIFQHTEVLEKKVFKLQIEYNDYRCKYIIIKLCTWIIDI